MIGLLFLTSLLLPLSTPSVPLDVDTWEAQLDAAQVVPPTDSPGTAVVTMTYVIDEFSDPRHVDFAITYVNLSSPPTGVHVRWGHNGENGPLAFTLVDGAISDPHYGSVDIPWDTLSRLNLLDTLYVVIPTGAFPEGEVRGVFTNVTPPAVEKASWGAVRASYR